ncbi:MAG: AAA family ATPase, partial [Ignavibacteriae bacterium]
TKIRHSRQTTTDLDLINGRVVATYVPGQEEGTITIVFTNAKADTVNKTMLDKLPGELLQSRTSYSGEATNARVPCEDIVRFKDGAQIVFINNDSSGRWYNGLIGTVTGVNGDVVKVTSRYGQKIDVPKVEFVVWDYVDKHGAPERVDSGSAFQYPFKLGWAITAHKSQGQTFDRVHIDITDAKAFADGQMYVALSRCRTLENLTISRRIHSKEIMVNKEAEEYSEKIRKAG